MSLDILLYSCPKLVGTPRPPYECTHATHCIYNHEKCSLFKKISHSTSKKCNFFNAFLFTVFLFIIQNPIVFAHGNRVISHHFWAVCGVSENVQRLQIWGLPKSLMTWLCWQRNYHYYGYHHHDCHSVLNYTKSIISFVATKTTTNSWPKNTRLEELS